MIRLFDMSLVFISRGNILKTRLMATAVVAAALVLGAQTSAFAYAPPVTPNTGAAKAIAPYSSGPTGEAPGTPAVVTLDGELAQEQASISLASLYTSSGLAVDANGELNVAVTLPVDAPLGSVYTLDVSAGAFRDSAIIVATAAPADGGVVGVPVASTGGSKPGALASTGVDATPYVWFGGGLLVLGAGLVSALAFVRRGRKNA
ncbi:MAG: cell wall anchor protein [Glaciihabitans sp.]|nr:cell wall anchor protein [Glaciihabitans sp.]